MSNDKKCHSCWRWPTYGDELFCSACQQRNEDWWANMSLREKAEYWSWVWQIRIVLSLLSRKTWRYVIDGWHEDGKLMAWCRLRQHPYPSEMGWSYTYEDVYEYCSNCGEAG